MSAAYSSLAAVYDRLNDGIDYAEWADYIERRFELYGASKPRSVLDLACGTGSMTVELARRGYDMTGVDLSDEMLAIAREKCDGERFAHPVLLVGQDMSELELYGTVNAVVCCLDSLNYLPDTGALARTFAHVHTYLDPDGLFIFDMNAPAKFERVYGQNDYILEDEGILCAWHNDYDPARKICRFELSVFRRERDGRWERFDETQRERCYSLRTVKRLLAEAGFELCELSGGMDGSPVNSDTERWHFTARAIKA